MITCKEGWKSCMYLERVSNLKSWIVNLEEDIKGDDFGEVNS